jgi:hypothetical protein
MKFKGENIIEFLESFKDDISFLEYLAEKNEAKNMLALNVNVHSFQ